MDSLPYRRRPKYDGTGTSIDSLPAELRLAIFEMLVKRDDIANLRLTCRSLADTGMSLMCGQISRLSELDLQNSYKANAHRNYITVVEHCSRLLSLSTYFPSRAVEGITSLSLSAPRRWLAHPCKGNYYLSSHVTERGYQVLDQAYATVRFPSLRTLVLRNMCSSTVLPLVKLIDAHAKSLRVLCIDGHVLRHRSVSLEQYRFGVGLRNEWRPLFTAMLSILDRPLSLDRMEVMDLDVLIDSRATAAEIYPARRKIENTPFCRAKVDRRSSMTLQRTSDESIQVTQTGRKPQNVVIDGKHAIRKGLQLLSTGGRRCLLDDGLE